MTSNVELDGIFSKYLPRGSVLPCSTLPKLHDREARVTWLQDAMKKRRALFFPLYVRHHWIAGVLRQLPKGKFLLETRDSAPSPIVRSDLRRSLKSLWPELVIATRPFPLQQPGSNDCGLFMAAAFFCDYLGAAIVSPSTIGARLRQLFVLAEKTNMDKKVFLAKMESELLRRSDAPLDGGGPRKRRRDSQATASDEERTFDPAPVALPTPPPNAAAYIPQGPAIDLFLEEDRRYEVVSFTGSQTPRAQAPRTAREVVQEMLAEGSRGMGQAHARGIAHLLVATGLLMVGDGKSRSLDVNSVGMRNYRLKKSGKTIPVTVADFIRQQGAALVEYNPAQPPLPVSGCLYVTTRSQSGLPASIGRLSFVVGSRQVTLTVNNRTQHSFDFTTDAATATVGVYLPGGVEYGYETRQTERHADAAPRERSPVGDRMEMLGDSQATQRLATQAAPRPQHKKKSGDDLEKARDTATSFPLNGESSLGGAPRVCTRSWQLSTRSALITSARQHG
eukprot:gene730-biopygen574